MTFRKIVPALATLILCVAPLHAVKTSEVVKVVAKADKPGADGSQTITLTLTIDKDYHIYANPVGNETLMSNQTLVRLTGKAKIEKVKLDYPAGIQVIDKVTDDKYKVYKDKAVIKATITRAKGDTGSLEFSIRVQACSKKGCLLPETIKVPVK